MKRSTFSEEQIVSAIPQADACTTGRRPLPTTRSEWRTFYAWKKKYAPRRERVAAPSAAGGRKQPVETVGR
jgi:hypothetical protein